MATPTAARRVPAMTEIRGERGGGSRSPRPCSPSSPPSPSPTVAINLGQGSPGFDWARIRQGGSGGGDGPRRQPVRPDVGHPAVEGGDRLPFRRRHRDRRRPGRQRHRDLGLRRSAGSQLSRDGRPRRRGGAHRAVLRPLSGGDRHGRCDRTTRDAAPAGVPPRRDRPGRRRRPPHPHDRAQHPAQPGGSRPRPCRARAGGLGGRRQRRRRRRRRGVRAPRVRRGARLHRLAPRHVGAHRDTVVAGEDVLAYRLEGGVGGRPGAPDRRGARRPPVHHLRRAHPAAARGGGRPGSSPRVLHRIRRRLPAPPGRPGGGPRRRRLRCPASPGHLLRARRPHPVRVHR